MTKILFLVAFSLAGQAAASKPTFSDALWSLPAAYSPQQDDEYHFSLLDGKAYVVNMIKTDGIFVIGSLETGNFMLFPFDVSARLGQQWCIIEDTKATVDALMSWVITAKDREKQRLAGKVSNSAILGKIGTCNWIVETKKDVVMFNMNRTSGPNIWPPKLSK